MLLPLGTSAPNEANLERRVRFGVGEVNTRNEANLRPGHRRGGAAGRQEAGEARGDSSASPVPGANYAKRTQFSPRLWSRHPIIPPFHRSRIPIPGRRPGRNRAKRSQFGGPAHRAKRSQFAAGPGGAGPEGREATIPRPGGHAPAEVFSMLGNTGVAGNTGVR